MYTSFHLLSLLGKHPVTPCDRRGWSLICKNCYGKEQEPQAAFRFRQPKLKAATQGSYRERATCWSGNNSLYIGQTIVGSSLFNSTKNIQFGLISDRYKKDIKISVKNWYDRGYVARLNALKRWLYKLNTAYELQTYRTTYDTVFTSQVVQYVKFNRPI